MANHFEKLSYQLPKNAAEAAAALGAVLGVPAHKIRGDADQIVLAMSGTILYRHLDRHERHTVMQQIHNLSSGLLKEALIAKCVAPLVNPKWAEWSLTNQELEDVLRFHNSLNRWSSVLGANPGAYGVGGSVWSIIKQGAKTGNVAVLAASLILMGIHEFSHSETQKYSAEIERRKSFN